MVLTSSTNAFTADQRIAAPEQEILKPTCANKTNPTEQPKSPELTTKPTPPPEKPTTQVPLHPFTNIAEASYQPPHEHNFATSPAKPAKDKEPAYHYVALIQNPRTVINIYNKSMQAPLVTISPEELFTMSPEVRNRLHEAITPK
jgi:hypothetical protein